MTFKNSCITTSPWEECIYLRSFLWEWVLLMYFYSYLFLKMQVHLKNVWVRNLTFKNVNNNAWYKWSQVIISWLRTCYRGTKNNTHPKEMLTEFWKAGQIVFILFSIHPTDKRALLKCCSLLSNVPWQRFHWLFIKGLEYSISSISFY